VKSWVPTSAMRNGNFNELPGLGLSGDDVNRMPDGFPSGMIPSNLIDPGGRVLLNQYPLPNADPAHTGGFNYVDNLLVDQNGTQLATRADLNFSDNTKMFVRYNRQREVQPFVIGLWWRNGEKTVIPAQRRGAVAAGSRLIGNHLCFLHVGISTKFHRTTP